MELGLAIMALGCLILAIVRSIRNEQCCSTKEQQVEEKQAEED